MSNESTSNPSNPRVDELVEEIRHIASQRRALQATGRAEFVADTGHESAGPLNNYLAELARRNHARTELPPRYRRFPFTLAPVQKIALRIYNLLTKDQRASNFLLRDALKTLQAELLRSQMASRETAVLTDYVRAMLRNGRGQVAATAGAPAHGAYEDKRRDAQRDAFFAALGDEFRGTAETIKERLRAYPPLISASSLAGPALDLGCGRGEWLELLREQRIDAVGVEQNALLADACRAKNLNVIEADLAAFLEHSPPDHWSIVSGFHVIEHLGWPAWYDCLRQMHRSLKPGGMLILETPNPDNLITAANRFYLDPTHRHPIPHALLAFAARSVGFSRVDILPLNANAAAAEQASRVEHPVPEALIDGPQDYALIARK